MADKGGKETNLVPHALCPGVDGTTGATTRYCELFQVLRCVGVAYMVDYRRGIERSRKNDLWLKPTAKDALAGWDWLFGVLSLASFVRIVMLKIGYGLMVDRNTKHPFEPQEMARWNRITRLTRAGIAPLPMGIGRGG